MKKDIIPFYTSSDIILEKSKDCYLYDTNGKAYIDFESGVWCANLGHSHDRILRVLELQSKKSIHHGYRFRNLQSEHLSVKLQQLIGYKNGASVFLSSGSEAVDLSISIAQKLTGRSKVLKISNSYLSAYGFGKTGQDNNYLENISFNDLEAVKNQDFSDIAAVVLETGGASIEVVKFPDAGFVKRLVEEAKNNNCLIIADEVTTGFGRLGKWFGFQHYKIKPNIVVTGKALGNGYPISSVTIDSNIATRLSKNMFIYTQSHQNDPLGCAIALEVINVINEEKVIENCVRVGQYFATKLMALKYDYPAIIKEIRAKGLMLAIEFYEHFNGKLYQLKLFERGFVVGFKMNTLRLLPPLVMRKKEIDNLIKGMKELFNEQGSGPNNRNCIEPKPHRNKSNPLRRLF